MGGVTRNNESYCSGLTVGFRASCVHGCVSIEIQASAHAQTLPIEMYALPAGPIAMSYYMEPGTA